MADAVTSDLNRHLSKIDQEDRLESLINSSIEDLTDRYHNRLIINGEPITVGTETIEALQFLSFLDTEERTPQDGLLIMAYTQLEHDCCCDYEMPFDRWALAQHRKNAGY